jgi:hypothetical protein
VTHDSKRLTAKDAKDAKDKTQEHRNAHLHFINTHRCRSELSKLSVFPYPFSDLGVLGVLGGSKIPILNPQT